MRPGMASKNLCTPATGNVSSLVMFRSSTCGCVSCRGDCKQAILHHIRKLLADCVARDAADAEHRSLDLRHGGDRLHAVEHSHRVADVRDRVAELVGNGTPISGVICAAFSFEPIILDVLRRHVRRVRRHQCTRPAQPGPVSELAAERHEELVVVLAATAAVAEEQEASRIARVVEHCSRLRAGPIRSSRTRKPYVAPDRPGTTMRESRSHIVHCLSRWTTPPIRGSMPTSTRYRSGSRRSAGRSASSSTPPTLSHETVKRRVQPYFVLDGNICALLAAKDHVNVFLYDGGIVPDPEGIITGGHTNKTARTVAVYEGESINARALSAMFSQIIANGCAGGWRRFKPES